MSHQNKPNSRREFLRKLAVIPAAGLAGAGLGSSCEATAATTKADYVPTFFNVSEWLFLNIACDHLIPHDSEGPGAIELNVPEFIDRQMNTAYGQGALWYLQGPFVQADPSLGYQLQLTPQQIYRLGIADTYEWCKKHHGKSFDQLDDKTIDSVLGSIEKGEAEFEHIPSATFFTYLLQNTREGYFADPMYGGNKNIGSWIMLGFPGARADFTEWVNQEGAPYPYGPVSILGNRG